MNSTRRIKNLRTLRSGRSFIRQFLYLCLFPGLWLAPYAGSLNAETTSFLAQPLFIASSVQDIECVVIQKFTVKLDLARPYIFDQIIYLENDTHDTVYALDLTTNQLTEQKNIKKIIFKYDKYLYVQIKQVNQPSTAISEAEPSAFALLDSEKKELVSSFILTDYPLLARLKTCFYYQNDEFIGTYWDNYNHFQLLKIKKETGYFKNLGFFHSPSFADIIDMSPDKQNLMLSTNQGVLLLDLGHNGLTGPYTFMGVGASPRSRGGFLANHLLFGHLSQNREHIILFNLDGKKFGEFRMLFADGFAAGFPAGAETPVNQKSEKIIADSLVFSTDLKKAIAADSSADLYLLDTQAFQAKLAALKLLFTPVLETTIQQAATPLLANPHLEAPLVTTLELNATVSLINRTGRKAAIGSYFDYWYQVKTQDLQSGWIYGPYLDQRVIPVDELLLFKTDPADMQSQPLSVTDNSDATASARTFTKEQTAIILIDRLRVRETPGLEGTKLGLLAKNEQVKVLKESTHKTKLGKSEDNWYYLISNTGLKGWVYGAYLMFNADEE